MAVEHRWFENRGEPCTLLVFIDDATSRLMQLRFVASESTGSYFEALQGYLATHGCPVYSDKHSVFRINRDAQGRLRHDAVRSCAGRAEHRDHLRELQPGKGSRRESQPHAAGSSGERVALENVCDMDAGNGFLPGFLERFNERFALHAAKPENLHRPLNVKADRLNDILCHREQRYVSEQLTMSYDRKQIIRGTSSRKVWVASTSISTSSRMGGPIEPLASLSPLQQGPACQPHGGHREQTSQPCAEDHQGTAGRKARAEGTDQQREDQLQKEPSSTLRTELQTEKRARRPRWK